MTLKNRDKIIIGFLDKDKNTIFYFKYYDHDFLKFYYQISCELFFFLLPCCNARAMNEVYTKQAKSGVAATNPTAPSPTYLASGYKCDKPLASVMSRALTLEFRAYRNPSHPTNGRRQAPPRTQPHRRRAPPQRRRRPSSPGPRAPVFRLPRLCRRRLLLPRLGRPRPRAGRPARRRLLRWRVLPRRTI